LLQAGVLDEFQLIRDTSQQQLGENYQMLQIQTSAPDDGQKCHPKHAELTGSNKLIYIN
jgi:hypothetical protein